MEGTQTLGTLAGIGVGRFTSWGRLDRKMERTCDTRDRKIDDLNAFLRDPVLEFTGESGELRGAVRPHPFSQDCFISVPPHPRPLPPGADYTTVCIFALIWGSQSAADPAPQPEKWG